MWSIKLDLLLPSRKVRLTVVISVHEMLINQIHSETVATTLVYDHYTGAVLGLQAVNYEY